MSNDVNGPKAPRKKVTVRLRVSDVEALTRIAGATALATNKAVSQQDLLDRALTLLIADMEARHAVLRSREMTGQGGGGGSASL